MPKIYTKSGDKGETSLFSGHRVQKNNLYINALGTVDECNSALGTVASHLPERPEFKTIKKEIEIIQHALFDIGAALATPRTLANKQKISKTRFDQEEIEALEVWIDQMNSKLAPLTSFILPNGHPSSALTHLARSICRRAEREVIPIVRKGDASELIVTYLNRLSDYLFILARYINYLTDTKETLWQHNKLAKHR